MKSRASINSHPLHPMMIVYPFAFLTGAFGFTVAAAASQRRDFRDVAGHLIPAGLVAGLAAAVPGIIDYLTIVPPRSSGKERATKHALLNVTGLVSSRQAGCSSAAAVVRTHRSSCRGSVRQ